MHFDFYELYFIFHIHFKVLGVMKPVSFLIWIITAVLGRTWRVKVISPSSVDIFDPNSAPKIYCFWHSTLLVTSYLFRNTGKAAIISPSKDGRIAAEVVTKWGYEVIYGSAHRGGAAALRQSVKSIRAGRSLGITPDGPKGPREIVKPGAAQIAIISKTPLVAIKVETKSAWRLKSWDRFMVPYPFAKITVAMSDPIHPPAATAEHGGASGGVDASAALTKLIQENLA